MSTTYDKLNAVGRSLVYQIAITCVTVGMGIACLPLLLLKHPTLKYAIPYRWTSIALWLQRYILHLTYDVRSHAPLASGGVIYAVKHQSAWETMALWHILDRPVFVLKKELLSIPVFGWYLAHADNIVIDRSAGKQAVAQIIDQSMKYMMQGRNIVMFPEGTRTRAGAEVKYKNGIGAVYEAISPTIHPVALNSGCFWGRNRFIRRAGVIELEILPSVTKNLSKSDFMQALHTQIETATARLVATPKYRETCDSY